jgi:hypothetical protein
MRVVHAHVEHHEKDREQRDGFDDGFEHESGAHDVEAGPVRRKCKSIRLEGWKRGRGIGRRSPTVAKLEASSTFRSYQQLVRNRLKPRITPMARMQRKPNLPPSV